MRSSFLFHASLIGVALSTSTASVYNDVHHFVDAESACSSQHMSENNDVDITDDFGVDGQCPVPDWLRCDTYDTNNSSSEAAVCKNRWQGSEWLYPMSAENNRDLFTSISRAIYSDELFRGPFRPQYRLSSVIGSGGFLQLLTMLPYAPRKVTLLVTVKNTIH